MLVDQKKHTFNLHQFFFRPTMERKKKLVNSFLKDNQRILEIFHIYGISMQTLNDINRETSRVPHKPFLKMILSPT